MSDVLLHPAKPVMLVPDAPDPSRFLRMVQPSRVMERDGNMFIAAPHNSDTVAAARKAGVEVPSSIATRYGWPGKFTPFDHQHTTAEFITLNQRCLVLNGMGTGKTSAALWAADHLMREGRVRRVLIVAPLSCLRPVWVREMFATLPHRSICVLHADRKKRLAMAAEREDDFFVVNHDGVGIVKDTLQKRGDIDMVIYDEASALKNAQTNRFKIMQRWLKANPDLRLCLMTGTPTPQAPTDAWALARLVNPWSHENPRGAPASFVRFRDSCMRQNGPYKWIPRANAQSVVRSVLHPAIRFRKEDCLDLPPVIYTDRFADLTTEQKKAFAEMKRQMVAEAETEAGEGVRITAINAAAKLSKILQLCSGAAYTEDGRTATFDMKHRLAALLEIIEEASKKVVVFIPFRHAIERVHQSLVDQGVTCDVLHGGIKGQARDLLLDRFMDKPNPRVLLAHPKTASHGLTLTVANTIVWFGPTFSAEGYQQANERCDRPGQDSKVTVVHLYSTDVERKAFQLLQDRGAMQTGILEMYQQEISND